MLQRFLDPVEPIVNIQQIKDSHRLREGATFFLPNTHGAEIHKALSPEPNEDVVIKHAPNSFFETNLHEIIKEKRIFELVVCGMMTHMCIDTTVRAAKDYKIPITLRVWH
jgi:nicotinamidase-related amidase